MFHENVDELLEELGLTESIDTCIVIEELLHEQSLQYEHVLLDVNDTLLSEIPAFDASDIMYEKEDDIWANY